jgi:hypothetical protein
MREPQPGEYIFLPKRDITLSDVVEMLRANFPYARASYVERLPPRVRRHFKIVEKTSA